MDHHIPHSSLTHHGYGFSSCNGLGEKTVLWMRNVNGMISRFSSLRGLNLPLGLYTLNFRFAQSTELLCGWVFRDTHVSWEGGLLRIVSY